jgi:hypothetical protein
MEFAQVYLNASPASAAQRAGELAQFLPPGTDPQLGWNGQGTLALESGQIAGIRSHDAHHGVVTLLVRLNGRLLELGVPVYAKGAQMVVSGEPSMLPPPARAVLPATQPVATDTAATAALTGQISDFFSAYAAGNPDTLARFTVPGAQITRLAQRRHRAARRGHPSYRCYRHLAPACPTGWQPQGRGGHVAGRVRDELRPNRHQAQWDVVRQEHRPGEPSCGDAVSPAQPARPGSHDVHPPYPGVDR